MNRNRTKHQNQIPPPTVNSAEQQQHRPQLKQYHNQAATVNITEDQTTV